MLSRNVECAAGSEAAYRALARIPRFKDVRLDTVELEHLGSLTNATYKVTTEDEVYVLRLPGKDTFEYIDRTSEEHNARITATAGINAEVLYFDRGDGTMLTQFLEGNAVDEGRFKYDSTAPIRAAHALKQVHRLGKLFRSR